jgi:hypothetical protein
MHAAPPRFFGDKHPLINSHLDEKPTLLKSAVSDYSREVPLHSPKLLTVRWANPGPFPILISQELRKPGRWIYWPRSTVVEHLIDTGDRDV